MSYFFGWSNRIELKLLYEVFLKVSDRLLSFDSWKLIEISQMEDGAKLNSYLRLRYVDKISTQISVKELNGRNHFVPAFHVFDQIVTQKQMHNHQVPAFILPFAEDASYGKVLYEMPWRYEKQDGSTESGRHSVKCWEPYGFLSALDFYHSVEGLRPHMSFNMADISKGAERENRLNVEQLPSERKVEICKRISKAVRSKAFLVDNFKSLLGV